MDLLIKNNRFLVTGASSGFGFAIAKALSNEGAKVIINSRDKEKLENARETIGNNVTMVPGDITAEETLANLEKQFQKQTISGVLVNAGGPPAASFEDSSMEGWDEAYRNVLRWKVDLMLRILPYLKKQGYGRILFLESASVKQPINNLVYSNSLRMAVIGAIKTLSQEIAGTGITLNAIAPGFHQTSAVDRIIKKKSEKEGISYESAEQQLKDSIPLKMAGNPDNFAKLALWLLSPSSEFVSGQVFYVDGGAIKATL